MIRGKKKIYCLILTIVITILGNLRPVFAYDLLAIDFSLGDFFRSKVEKNDELIYKVNTLVDQSMQQVRDSIADKTRAGFSSFEQWTGVNEQNSPFYAAYKYQTLQKIGFHLGIAEGVKDIVMGAGSLLVQVDALPARTINLAYNVYDKPQEYKEKATGGAAMLAGVLANPLPVLGGIYQLGKDSLVDTWTEAKKDPLKMGQLQGEVGVFGASLFVGGGQLKAVSNANKVGKVTVTGSIVKNTSSVKKFNLAALLPDLPAINLGFGSGIPVGVGAGKGITAKIFSGLPQTKNMVFSSSVADSGRIKAIKTSADARFSIPEYPFLVKSRGSILKSNDPKDAWIKDLTTTPEMRATLREWGESAFAPWRNLLTKQEKEALYDYTRSARLVNPILRGINKDYNPTAIEQIKLISSGLQKAELPEMYLFRGSGYRLLGDLEGLPTNELIGKTIELKGFVSTSLFPNALFVDGVQMIIKVPRGVNGGYLGLDDLSRFPVESEVLLQHGQKLKILEVQQLPEEIWYKGGLHIVAEIIP